MMCGTFTYPVAVRVARKVFRLRGFYPIHISIAPFLALIHVNIMGTSHALLRALFIEKEFERLRPRLSDPSDSNDPQFRTLNKLI